MNPLPSPLQWFTRSSNKKVSSCTMMFYTASWLTYCISSWSHLSCSFPVQVARSDVLRSASLVNRSFANASRPYVFRRLTINIGDREKSHMMLEFLSLRPDLRSHVREIVLTSPDRCRFTGQVGRVTTFSGANDPVVRLENAINEEHFPGLRKLRYMSLLECNQSICSLLMQLDLRLVFPTLPDCGPRGNLT